MFETFSLYLDINPAAKAGLFFVLGACLGSFLNVLLYRIPRGREWVKTPSACPSCGHKLGTLDLIPILSWILLRGKCRYCSAPVSARYPVIEALCGAAFAALAFISFR